MLCRNKNKRLALNSKNRYLQDSADTDSCIVCSTDSVIGLTSVQFAMEFLEKWTKIELYICINSTKIFFSVEKQLTFCVAFAIISTYQ